LEYVFGEIVAAVNAELFYGCSYFIVFDRSHIFLSYCNVKSVRMGLVGTAHPTGILAVIVRFAK
jgi:hypothetical protein